MQFHLKFRNVSRKRVLAGVLIFGLVVLVAVLYTVKNTSEAGIPVKTARSEVKPMQDNVFASGRVRLCQKQEFYTFTATTVKELKVSPGDQVHRGQVLGLLDPGELEDEFNEAQASFAVQESNLNKAIFPRDEEVAQERANCRRAEADYNNAQKKYERTKYLFEQGAVSAEEFDDANSEMTVKEAEYRSAAERLKIKESGPTGHELNSLRAQMEQARTRLEQEEKKLSKTILRAEMDGVVTAVEVAVGDYIQPGTRLITIGNTGQLEVTAGVSEADSGRLKAGQKVKVTAAANPDREFSGVLESVSPGAVSVKTADKGNQIEVPVTVKIVGDTDGLRPGYTVDLNIVTADREKALVVPYEAVVEKNGARKVFTVENQMVKSKEVTTGIDNAIFTEILSGLAEGETVIVGPDEKLADGSRVKEVANLPSGKGGGR